MPRRRRPGAWFGIAAAVLCMPFNAGASQAAAAAAPDAQQQIESFVRTQFGPQYRVELSFGQLSPSLRLSPCARVEPFLSPGARLWGRTSIGVRCVDGANWSVALPMTVSVFGPGLVASHPIAPNTPVSTADFHLQEVELSEEPRPVLTESTQVEGRISTRALAAGQAVRDYYLRVLPTVRPGDPVRIRVLGQGFVVVSDGSAMAAAGEGQPVRVRTQSGKIMLGTVNGRAVDVKL